MILGNVDNLPSLTAEEQNFVAGYQEQKRIASNYPYQFSSSLQMIMENLIKQIFNSYMPIEKSHNREMLLHYIGIIGFIIIGFLFLILN